MFTGLLLKESLLDDRVLDLLSVTKTEVWQVENPSPLQPARWTALTFECDQAQAEVIAQALSRAIKPRGWYINASSGDQVYVIFPGRVFRYARGDLGARAEAQAYARTLDVPERQLDWGE
jgi:hypothetical protein